MSTPETDPLVIRERLTELFKHPNLLPENLLAFLVDYLAVNMPEIPIGHIIGSTAVPAVTGQIPAAGTTPTAGTDFTYTHTNGTGVYVFTFTTAFAAAPVVICQALFSVFVPWAWPSAVTASGFTVTTYTYGTPPTAGDMAFHFIAQAVT